MQKLGQQRKSIELAVPNVELAWKIDDEFMRARQGLRAADAREQADPPDARPRPVRHHAVPVMQRRSRTVLTRAGRGASGRDSSRPRRKRRSPRARRRQLGERVRAVVLGVGFPVLLVLLWHLAVALHGHAARPEPARRSRVMMYDFAFGGIYDDAFSGTILTHIWKSMQRVYGGFFAGRADRHPARPDDRPDQAAAPAARSDASRCCGRSR